MEALARAAVAEICGLVDDGYAVLQLEISRSHKENEALRRKLELIESIIARGSRRGAAGAPLEDVAVGGGLEDAAVGEFSGTEAGKVYPRFWLLWFISVTRENNGIRTPLESTPNSIRKLGKNGFGSTGNKLMIQFPAG